MQRFADAITDRTRLIFASHVSCATGEPLPVDEICRLAHDHGALVAVDGAHALGQFPFDLAELGPDFYVGCGQKWLLGPQGTGLLYVSRRQVNRLQPSWLGCPRAVFGGRGSSELHVKDSARRFEFATKPRPLCMGLNRSIQYLVELGLETIVDRVGALARGFRSAVEEVPGITLLTPPNQPRNTGLVSAITEGFPGPDIRQVFWDRWVILVSSYAPANRVRFSVAFFTTEGELEFAAQALQALSREIHEGAIA